MMRCVIVSWILLALLTAVPLQTSAQTNSSVLQIRFLDAATGFGVPAKVTIQPNGSAPQEFWADASGRATLSIVPGDYSVSISSTNHLPMNAGISVGRENPNLQFALDPLVRPAEIQPEQIIAAHQPAATIFTGFVSGEDSGQPLANVKVSSLPSGKTVTTDARGFFQLAVPLQTEAEREVSPAKLVFSRTGYETQERHNLELSPFGDFTLQVRLNPGSGSETLDEQGRQISSDPAAFSEASAPVAAADVVAASINPTNSTVRLPTNIRVLLADGVTVEYVSMETYVKRSLNDEWISSWGNISGGINSLKAGAVAIRSYAASYVRSPRGSSYDICATTSCQVYDTDQATVTDTAATQTAGYVVLDSNNAIARSEYSAENNSEGFACGDGYTAPSGGCIYDPACAGEVRFGHGRGMCQWGTARWATGRKMAGRNSGDSTPNGFPKQDWIWIVNHYYPTLKLVQAKPLVIGDDVKAVIATTVRQCAGGGIESGVNCPSVASKTAGATGVIIAGPVQVASDGSGFTWWQIQWSDGVTGWTVENYIERIVPIPGAPNGLSASAVSSTQINLGWNDTTQFENGFTIERALSAAGPWLQVGEVAQDVTTFSDTNVTAGNTFFYRVRSFNVTGASAYSNSASAATPGTPPVFPAIANKSVMEGTTLIFTNVATASDIAQTLTDFEGFDMETTSGSVLFRYPIFSGSTGNYLDASPNYSSVTTLFPPTSGSGSKALFVHCDFTNLSGAWLRLSTAGTANIPNPVIDFRSKLQFRIFSDKPIKVGLGLRETTTAAGTPIGFNGGTSGAIEWVGVTSSSGTTPVPVRTVPANVWTTLTFDLPNEPVVNFASGNGTLSTPSGLGVLEHVAIVPLGGVGPYKFYFDNFVVLKPRTITYTLASGSPSNATVNAANGVFTWTPSEAQGPGTYNLTLGASDNSSPALTTLRSFTVTVSESNIPPALVPVANRTVYVGNSISITNSATDPDLPANSLSFDFVTGPSGASIGAANGIFSWTPTEADAGTTNLISVRVLDNGSPQMSDTNSFMVMVMACPTISFATVSDHAIHFSWTTIPGSKYRVQFKTDLNEATWTDLQSITADAETAEFNEPIAATQRFYRLFAE